MKLYEVSDEIGSKYGFIAENYEEAVILLKEVFYFDVDKTTVKELEDQSIVSVLFGDEDEVLGWDFTNEVFSEEERVNVKEMSAVEFASLFE